MSRQPVSLTSDIGFRTLDLFMSTITEALTIALQSHQAGDLQRAETIYRQILQADPAQAVALHFLGVIAHQVGKQEVAIDYMKQSLELTPYNEGFHCNLGMAYQALGQFDQAIASYREALRLRPEYFDAHNNLANVLADQGKLDEASAGYQRALALNPNCAEAHSNLGVALQRLGKLDDAETHCRKGVRLKPDSIEARINLGNVQTARGKLDEAALNYREALRIKPDYALAHNNLGGTLQLQGKTDEAVVSYRQALQWKPDYAEAHGNLATALQIQGNLDEAERHLREALRYQPGLGATHNNLGGILQLEGKFEEAINHFREAMRLMPGDASAHSNVLLCMNYDPKTDLGVLFEEHREWGRRWGVDNETRRQRDKETTRQGDNESTTRRLKVGYVSPDLTWHPIAHFLQPILANHDPDQVQAICYAEVSAPDAMTARLKTLSREWRSVSGLTDQELAKLVRADGIDILVDLAGHTAKSRLRFFAHQPAPVQVTYLGYPYTTGLSTIQYRLTDAVADPPGEPVSHTEELIRLPGGFCCYAPPSTAPDPGPLPAQKAGYITFGSLHALHRLNAEVLDLWSAILRAVPTAHLLIFRHTLRGNIKEGLFRQFNERGIEAARIDMRQDYSKDDSSRYLAVYQGVDVSLDTFPWSGHTTACESLWMGVPVITLRGNRHAGRMVASVLTQIGLPDFIAESPEQYVEKAVQAAQDIERLAKLRSELRDLVKNSPLCDGKKFARNLEAAYREMWVRLCKQC
jgi:protein O-GlcNAc transferase